MIKEAINLKEFFDVARLLGHNSEELKQGKEIISYLSIPTVEEGIKILSRATKEQKIERARSFFNPPIAARQRLGQGTHDRGEAAVFAVGEICVSDEHGLGNHLPTHSKAISVLSKQLKRGEVWDVSVRGDRWGLDEMEELYCVVNVGELIMEPESSIIIRGNVFSFVCQKLIKIEEKKTTNAEYDIGILPTPFSVDYGEGTHDGAAGLTGSDGTLGVDGLQYQLSPSILGPIVIGEFDPEKMNGTSGTFGEDGTDGQKGRNGGACKLAEITLRHVEGNVTVFAQAGKGGNGGAGGDGGNGGEGGKGSNGFKTIGGIIEDGKDGIGGSGGTGGKGGHAGHGGISSNIYINVPEDSKNKITRISLASEGGMGGKGGAGGKSGLGGQDGLSGKNGKNGRSRPAPWMFLNEVV